MRRPWPSLIALSWLLADGAAVHAAPAPISVVYQVEATAGSWRPLTLSDVARVVEAAALEELTRSGRLRLERHRGPGSTQPPGDYQLLIRSHVLDEAQTHTVSVRIGPGTQQDLPSLNTSRTVVLAKLDRGRMLERIEGSARDAARGLVARLKAPLARLDAGASNAPVDDPFPDAGPPPWQWAPVRVPPVSSRGAAKRLYSRAAKKRQAALRVLTSLALVEDSERHVLERCALQHPNERTRVGCLEALRPLSRRIEPTARVVVEVYRQDASPAVRREANDQMVYFTGPSKEAAIQAWLEAAGLGRDSGPLEELGDLPNLDLAIRSCLEATGKHRASSNKPRFRCIALLEPLPHLRRRALLWRFIREKDPASPYYLAGAGEREGSIGTPWQRAVDALLEDLPAWDPELEEVLWARYQRTLSHAAMSILCSWGAPSPRLADRLLEILQTKGEGRALTGLLRMARAKPTLRPRIKDKLSEMLALGAFSKDVDERRLTSAIRKIDKEDRR